MKIVMSQPQKDSKEPSTKKMILESISKNEIKRPSELEVMKKSKKHRNRAYKALPKLVEDRMLCKYEESDTETYYWLSESDVDEIEEKLRDKVPGLGKGKIPSNNVIPRGWFKTKKEEGKREEKLLRKLDTRVKSLTKKGPTEKDDLEDLFPGNRRVVEIRDFIEKEDMLPLAHKSESLMDLLESSYKDFKEAGKMDIHGGRFPGGLLYFEVWDHALDDEDNDLVVDGDRVNILLDILEKRLDQMGLEYWESIRVGNGDYWDDESNPPLREMEIMQSILEKLEDEEKRVDEDKLKDLEARLNEVL